jgi:hypothetical protein
MRNLLSIIAIVILINGCSHSNIESDSTDIPPKVVFTNQFKKHLTFNHDVFSSSSAYSQAEIDKQKSNYIISYNRALRLATQNSDGTIEFNATKERLNISEELFNMVKYFFDDANKSIKQMNEKHGDNFSVS